MNMIKRRFWFLSILLAVVFTVAISFAFSPVRAARAEGGVKENEQGVISDVKYELEVNIVRCYPSEPIKSSVKSNYDVSSYTIIVSSASSTYTLNALPGITGVNWGDGYSSDESALSGQNTYSHVFDSPGVYYICIYGATALPRYIAYGNGVKLTAVTISSSISNIHPTAFYGQTFIDRFFVSEGNPYYCTENYNSYPAGSSSRSSGSMILSRDGTVFYHLAPGFSNETCTVPFGVTRVGPHSVSSCSALRTLIIPDSVISCDDTMCENCQNLNTVIIGVGIESIDRYLAYMENDVKSIVIKSSSPPSIHSEAFEQVFFSNNSFIYVPAENVDTYKAAWSSYAEYILPMTEEMSDYFTGNLTTPDEPTEPSDSTETNTDEKKPFDFGEWIYNAGENVSAWLGENVGIATTGSTVLIIGAVIIAVILLKKRR